MNARLHTKIIRFALIIFSVTGGLALALELLKPLDTKATTNRPAAALQVQAQRTLSLTTYYTQVIINGNFEDDAQMPVWHFDSGQYVARTTAPHYFAPGESWSIVLPNALVLGWPRHPWLYQEFTMPAWVTNNTTGLTLTLRVALSPFSAITLDPLYVLLRDENGAPLDAVSLTGTIPYEIR